MYENFLYHFFLLWPSFRDADVFPPKRNHFGPLILSAYHSRKNEDTHLKLRIGIHWSIKSGRPKIGHHLSMSPLAIWKKLKPPPKKADIFFIFLSIAFDLVKIFQRTKCSSGSLDVQPENSTDQLINTPPFCDKIWISIYSQIISHLF